MQLPGPTTSRLWILWRVESGFKSFQVEGRALGDWHDWLPNKDSLASDVGFLLSNFGSESKLRRFLCFILKFWKILAFPIRLMTWWKDLDESITDYQLHTPWKVLSQIPCFKKNMELALWHACYKRSTSSIVATLPNFQGEATNLLGDQMGYLDFIVMVGGYRLHAPSDPPQKKLQGKVNWLVQLESCRCNFCLDFGQTYQMNKELKFPCPPWLAEGHGVLMI